MTCTWSVGVHSWLLVKPTLYRDYYYHILMHLFHHMMSAHYKVINWWEEKFIHHLHRAFHHKRMVGSWGEGRKDAAKYNLGYVDVYGTESEKREQLFQRAIELSDMVRE